MTTYYIPSQQSSTRRGRSAARNSYVTQPMSSPGYQQAQFYYPNSPVTHAYSDNGHGYVHQPRHNSLGPGGPAYAQPAAGTYYVARSPSRHGKRSSSHHHSSNHGHGHSHHSNHGHRRSHSTHNHHHRSASRPRRSHSATPHRRYTIDTSRPQRYYVGSSRYPTSHLSLGDRIRKFFGIGPWGHHSSRAHHKARFTDGRSSRGRTIVRY